MSVKDIMVISGCSKSTAKREHRTVRDALGILHPKLTVKQYADYWGIDYDLVVEQINVYR